MTEIISLELDIKGLSSKAVQVLKAAVTIGLQNQAVQMQRVSIADFCKLADLPAGTSSSQLHSLFDEARKALGSLEVTDIDCQNQDETWASWPVFNQLHCSSDHVSFEICRHMYHQDVYSILLGSNPVLLSLCEASNGLLLKDN